jgi:3-deoxy-D-manno-octulosonate 8-phosphate phosphatase (KDO 8-P phosphatase)
MTTQPGTETMSSLAERCLKIELLLLDVDGVLTDGGIIYSEDGPEIKGFHVRDGSGLKIWRHLGKRAAMISGRTSYIAARRARELDIEPVIQGALDKWPAYQRVLAETRLRPDQVCVMGDDVPDIPLLRNCGLAVAVADACPDAREEAHYVTGALGGRGAVREAIELILRAQGTWQGIIEDYRSKTIEVA